MTSRMAQVARTVARHCAATGGWYRAAGNGERVSLAALWRAGVLERRAWRGVEGEADAAHEYRPVAAIRGAGTRTTPTPLSLTPSEMADLRAGKQVKLCWLAEPGATLERHPLGAIGSVRQARADGDPGLTVRVQGAGWGADPHVFVGLIAAESAPASAH